MNSLLESRSAAGVIGLYCVKQHCQHQIAVVCMDIDQLFSCVSWYYKLPGLFGSP